MPRVVIAAVETVERIWLWTGGCGRLRVMKWVELESAEERGGGGGK